MAKKVNAKEKDCDYLSQVEREAMDAIEAVFSDMSVDKGETAARLRNIRSEIDMKLEGLK